MDPELVEITMNHKGVDVVAHVTLAEANVLLNDEVAAAQYVEDILGDAEEPKPDPVDEQGSGNVQVEGFLKNFNTPEGTLLFLKLRTQFDDQFNDKKNHKNSLWRKISEEIKKEGYDLGVADSSEKLRQKFANMQRTYMNYIKHMKTTGEGRRDPPPYFNEMNKILGCKDKVHPQHLEDTEDSQPSCSSSSSEHEKQKFSSSHISIRPTSNFNKMLQLCKEQHEQARKDKEDHMKIFQEAVKVQNEQRERLLQFLIRGEKRKRRSSSESSSD